MLNRDFETPQQLQPIRVRSGTARISDISNIMSHQRNPSEDESFLQDFNFNRKQQLNLRFQEPKYLKSWRGPHDITQIAGEQYSTDTKLWRRLNEAKLMSSSDTMGSLQRLVQLTKEGVDDFDQCLRLLDEKQGQLTTVAQDLMNRLTESSGQQQLLQKLTETQHAQDQLRKLQGAAQHKFEFVIQLATQCWNSFLNQVPRREDPLIRSQSPHNQVAQRELVKLKQQLYDTQAENAKFHELLKNRESHHLAFSVRRQFIDDSTDDERLMALEKERLTKKVSRLQKRLEEEQENAALRRKDYLMKEKELVAQRELILSHKEQKESEILDMQAQLDQMIKQCQFKNEQIRQLERQLDDRRRTNDSGPVNDVLRNLKQQLRQQQDENRTLQQQNTEAVGERDREISELEERVTQLASEMQERDDQIVKMKKERDRQQSELMKHAQSCIDTKSELIDVQRIMRKLEREVVDHKRQLDLAKKTAKDAQQLVMSQESQLFKLQAQVDSKDEQIVQFSQELSNLQALIDSLQAQQKHSKDTIFKIQILNKQLEQRLQEREMQLQILRREGTDFENKLSQLQQQYSDQLNNLNDKLQESQAIVYQYRQSLENQQSRLSELEDTSVQLKSDVQRLESQRRMIDAELQEKTSLLINAQQTVQQQEQTYQEQMQRTKEKYVEQVAECQRLEADLEELRNRHQTAKQESQQLLEVKEGELGALRKSTNDQLIEEKRVSKQLRLKLQEQQSEFDDVRRHNFELKKSLQDKEQQLDSLLNQQTTESAPDTKDELQFNLNQIQKLKQEVKAKEKKCAAADDRIKALLKSLAEKQDEIDSLRQSMESLKNEHSAKEQLMQQQAKAQQHQSEEQEDHVLRLQAETQHLQSEMQLKNEEIAKLQQRLIQTQLIMATKEERIASLTKTVQELQRRPKSQDDSQEKLQQCALQIVDAKEKCQVATNICKVLSTAHVGGKQIEMVTQLLGIMAQVMERLEGLALLLTNPDYSFGDDGFEQH